MRTTLAIADDVLAAAKHLAARQQTTLGETISSLVRKALVRSGSDAQAVRNGIPLLSTNKNGSPVTLELVNQLRDEQA